MRLHRHLALLLVAILAVLGSSLSLAPANASSRPGLHRGAHRGAPLNHRTGLPIGDLATRAQAKRMARLNTAPTQNAVASYHLTYNGGPVVSNVQVQPVRWGSGTYIPEVTGTASPNMQTFFSSVTQTPYPGWLPEYNTPASGGTGQQIGAGSVLAPVQIAPAAPANATTIDDAQIQAELFNQIQAGTLPQPAVDSHGLANTTYALYFPSGVNICQDSGLTQCSGFPPGNPTGSPVFCGYHSSFALLDQSNQKVGDVRYIVLPDSASSLWQSGCADSSSANPAARGLEAVASHELAEVITDPEVGEATSFAAPLGWYDGVGANNDPGEIADICDLAQTVPTTPITGTDGQSYTLENLWSNRKSRCGITMAPTSATNVVATANPGGTITVNWSAPTIGGGAPVDYLVYGTPYGGTLSLITTTTSTTWTSGALNSGTPYIYMIEPENSSGAASGVETSWVTADGTAPTVAVSTSLPAYTLSGSARISYSATDADSPSGFTYDVAYKSTAWNGAWSGLATLSHGTTATSASLAVRPGYEYCLVVRARDAVGNVSAWSSPRCTAAPLDDTGLVAKTTGWTRARTSVAYRSTLTRTSTPGSRLTVSGATASSLGLLVATCPTCGNVQIWLGNSLWRTVSTRSSAWHYKHLVIPGSFSLRRTSVTIRSVSGLIVIDGLGAFRPAPTF